MITDKDIQRIISALTPVFVTKEEHKQDHIEIITILDGVARSFEDLRSEYFALKTSDNRQNRQIHQLAHATGVDLED